MASFNQIAAKLDGAFYRGDDYTLPLQIMIDGNVTNTTSYTFDGQMVTSGGNVAAVITRLADVTGNIAVVFSDSQTANLPSNDATVSINLTMTNAGYTRTVVTGEHEVLERG